MCDHRAVDTWLCWRCGAELKELILPVSRRDECPECRAELHACKLCKHYAGKRANWCREERAEPPRDPEAANFCDYFHPRTNAYAAPGASADDQARAALDALFGGGAQPGSADDDPLDELKRLFDEPSKKDP